MKYYNYLANLISGDSRSSKVSNICLLIKPVDIEPDMNAAIRYSGDIDTLDAIFNVSKL